MTDQPDRIRVWNEETSEMTEPMTTPTMLRALGDFPGESSAYDHLVFMRNTGIYDHPSTVLRRGVEIFDGDLVTHSIEPYVYRVVQKRGCWLAESLWPAYTNTRLLCRIFHPTIVGNVFENKELVLKGEVIDDSEKW